VWRHQVKRRSFFGAIGAASLAPLFGGWRETPPPDGAAAQTPWTPPPPMVEATAVEIGGAQLVCSDSGGDGPAIILLHPATGSHRVWGYQQSFLARAGYRVIAYSRRGFAGSSPTSTTSPEAGATDLDALMTRLGLARAHLVGSAAGAFVVSDFAISFPERAISLTIASTFGGITDPAYRALIATLTPEGFDALPASFRELGPAYRAAYPQGVAAWEALEHESADRDRPRQPTLNRLTWAALASISAPTLVMSGGADLYMPAPIGRTLASHFPNSRLKVVPDVGHSLYWEEPDAFNAGIIDFLQSLPPASGHPA